MRGASPPERVGVLVELDGPNAGRRIKLPATLTIGCEQTADGSWTGGALIVRKGPGRYAVKEVDARSQVFLNDERVVQAWMESAAFLRVGERTYRFFLEVEEAAPAPAAPAAPVRAAQTAMVHCRRCGVAVPRDEVLLRSGRPVCRRCVLARRRPIPTGAIVGLATAAVALVVLFVALRSRGGDAGSATEKAAAPSPASASAKEVAAREKGPGTTADLVASIEDGVALVSGAGYVGTGFLVAEGILATNAHVVEGIWHTEIRVQFPSRERISRSVKAVLYQDNRRDLCLLRVDAEGPVLPLAQSVPFRRGEEVLLIGNPGVGDEMVLENAVTQGLMSAEAEIEGERFIQISAAVNPGNSGGPVLNRKGLVVCVATLKAGGVEGIAFGIPATDVQTALNRARRVGLQEIRTTESRHDAQVVFCRLAGLGTAYLTGMSLNVEALQAALAAGRDPSTALWIAKSAFDPYLDQVRSRLDEGLGASFATSMTDPALDAGVKQLLKDLRSCLNDLTDYVDDPRGRIDTYLVSYRQLRVRMASLISRLSDELEMGGDLTERLPEER